MCEVLLPWGHRRREDHWECIPWDQFPKRSRRTLHPFCWISDRNEKGFRVSWNQKKTEEEIWILIWLSNSLTQTLCLQRLLLFGGDDDAMQFNNTCGTFLYFIFFIFYFFSFLFLFLFSLSFLWYFFFWFNWNTLDSIKKFYHHRKSFYTDNAS